jgi:holo-[acyl-carrier protein] synthase
MKPLRAFPFPINIGNDICQISRIYAILSGPRAARFVNRVLSPEELAVNHARINVLDSVKAQKPGLQDALHKANKTGQPHTQIAANNPEMWSCAAFIAGRFAAKEAAMKAHPHRRLTFHDVVIERRPVEGPTLGSGPPIARIRSGEGEVEDTSALVTISHDGDYATAVCIGYEPDISRRG